MRAARRPLPTDGCRIVPLTADLFALAMACQDDPVINAHQVDVLPVVLRPNRAFAILDGGVLVCAYGIFPLHFGRWQGWMFTSTMASRRQLVFAVRQAREHFDRWQIEDPAGCQRIELHIRDDRPWRESFAAALGMNECVGPMRKWDPIGRSYWLYARIT